MKRNVFSYSFCIFASSMQEELRNMNAEEKAAIIQTLSSQLLAEGRTDLLLKAISVPVLEQLRIEAARATLSPLVITEDYRFLLPEFGNKRGTTQSYPQGALSALPEPSGRY